MATRKNYLIEYDGKEVIKHAWNSSLREIESIVAKIAGEEKQNYYLVEKETIKDGFYAVKGFRTWKGANGKIVKFEIKKLD